ncbi:hypothetical protein K469DRAFT_694357 [Zopfia rhizophila CBS 207.26]|uniref:Uncharacterized protein n=1 Tax=Zopfia rhizophila CBS 207.26 TaxID=1314779 RepID=A0A6A6EM32_9PEZI|nr:hypothetical protein K469DRAFT_694357 [Zopfia rhizophila CBS 207.26]
MLDKNHHQKPMISKLVRKEYASGSKNGDVTFTAEEFDQVFGGYDALTDMPIAVLAAELVQAYPDAKVILNRRKDIDAWYNSTIATIMAQGDDRMNWFRSWFCADLYWTRRLMFREMMPWFYRGDFRANGKWVYREHCAMVRDWFQRNDCWSGERRTDGRRCASS